jgi:hypothetical protein
MRKLFSSLAALAAICFCALAPAAEAKGFGRFGEDQTIHEIQPLTIPEDVASAGVLPPEWAEGAQLGYMTTTHWFGAGLYMSQDGYVIHQPGTDSYWDLDAEGIAELQAMGVLPDPLPAFSPPVIEYVFGYSLWIVIAVLVLWYGGRALMKRKPSSRQPEPADAPPAA